MALNANKQKSSGTKFERPPTLEPGAYPVRLVQILTLGLQKQRPYKGEPKDPAQELYLTYEFLDEFMLDEDGNEIKDKPRWLSERLPFHNLDADLAKSTKRYYALDPESKYEGDWSKMGGFPGILTITRSEPDKKDIVYNNVHNLSGMRSKDEEKAPPLVNPAKIFDIDDPDMEVFGSLPEWLQDVMKGGLEYDGSPLQQAIESDKGGSEEKSVGDTQEPATEVSDTDTEEDW